MFASAAAKLSRRPTSAVASPVGLENIRQTYNFMVYEELIARLDAAGAQDRPLFGHIRGIGLGVLSKAKKLWAHPEMGPTTPEVTVSDSFDIPHIFISEETRTPFNPIRRRAHVQAYRDAHLDAHNTTQNMYNFDHEGEREHHYEADPSASAWSEDHSHLNPSNDHQYQDLYTIPEESENDEELRDSECRTILDDNNYILGEPEAENDGTSKRPEAGDNTNFSIWSHDEGGTPPIGFSNTGSPWTAPSLTSIFFCPPTPALTLAPLTPSGSESGPSTPRDTPVLVHGSASYEDALFLEFKAIISQKGIEDDVEWDVSQDTLARRQTMPDIGQRDTMEERPGQA